MARHNRPRRMKYRLRRAFYHLTPYPPSGAAEQGLSPNVLDHLKKIRDREMEEMHSLKDRLLRAHADMDNLRKRLAREKQDIIKFANENLICALLPILDNFDHAWKAAESSPNFASFHQGISLIYQLMQKVLNEAGLETINALGQSFDPKIHEAISAEYKEDVPENQIVNTIRKGYLLKGRLIRPALVRVNKKPEQNETPRPSALKPNPLIKAEPLNSHE